MNIQQYLAKILGIIEGASGPLANRIRVPAANRLLGNTKNRIIRQGLDSSGNKIGVYKSRPGAYYSRNAFVKKGSFKGVGKGGEIKFKNGQSHKSMYLEQNYLQFRQIQGRGNTVNMELSGDMMLDYQSQLREKSIVQGFTQKKQSDKRKGNEKRFGKNIFASTQKDIAAYHKECAEGYKELTLELLRK